MAQHGISGSMDESSTLQGWKEIAGCLSVTVRTAQAWEKDRDLPVRRMPGKRSVVYCDRAELEAWRESGASAKKPEPRRSYLVGLAAAAAGLVVAGALGWRHDNASQQTELLQAVPLTNAREFEGRADISPDGRQVAFLVRGQSPTASVHALDLETRSRRILAADALEESAVRWSPSGDRLAYVRRSETGLEIIEIDPEVGGARVAVALEGADRSANVIDNAVFDWAEPGLAISAREGSGPFFIALASPDGGESRRVTTPPPNTGGDSMPAFSRDGRSIAFARFSSFSECDLYVVDLESGREQRLTDESARIWGFDWLPDGSIVYPARIGLGNPQLRRITPGGEPSEPVTGSAYTANYPVVGVDPSGQTLLLYEKKEHWSSIRRVVLDTDVEPELVVDSTWVDAWPDISPDGKRLAFISARSGATEVWVTSAVRGEEEAVRLTQQNGPFSDMPRWSPDGAKISFTSADVTGNRDVYLIDVATRQISKFTTEVSEEGRASWSRDGQWIYFRSDRSGSRQIWKQRLDGTAPAIQLTTEGGYEAFESFEGGTLYYVRSRLENQLWSVPIDGGEAHMVVAGPGEARWRVVAGGVVFQQDLRLLFWDAAENDVTPIFDIPADRDPYFGFVVSPDLRTLWWAQSDRNASDLWMSEL